MSKTPSMQASQVPAPCADSGGLSADPWQWGQQMLALEMSWWMSMWQLQLHWLSGGAPGLAQWPEWMVWHNGTEQLA